MKSPLEIVSEYPQIYSKSCVAWGIEAWLKIFEKPFDDFFLQNGSPNCGFGDGIKDMLRKEFSLDSWEDSYGDNFEAFIRAVNPELDAGRSPLLIMPTMVFYDEDDRKVKLALHTYVVCRGEVGDVIFLTRSGSETEVISQQEMAHRHHKWHPYISCMPGQIPLLHTLFAKPL